MGDRSCQVQRHNSLSMLSGETNPIGRLTNLNELDANSPPETETVSVPGDRDGL